MPSVPAERWLTVPDLKVRFRVRSASTIWNWVAKGLLPKPHHIRQRAVWRPEEITAAEEQLVQPPRAA
jgi:predicted DNA-binding transcriptional regulator AlpA